MPAAAGSVRSLVREAGPGDVAVELEWLGHPLVFVGARRAPGATDDHAAFEEAVARAAQSDPSDPARALAELAGGTPSQPDHVELGAANAWQSVGPLRLWTREVGHAVGSVESLLRTRPELTFSPVPVALEVAFAHPRPCWLGVEVSRPCGDGYAVEHPTVDALLGGLFRGERP